MEAQITAFAGIPAQKYYIYIFLAQKGKILMDPNNMSFEEWVKYMDENYGGDASDSQSACPDEESGNPYGAGQYGYIRSSEKCKALNHGKSARGNSEYNRWFEHIRCAYACWRDEQSEQEYDDMYREQLEKKTSTA